MPSLKDINTEVIETSGAEACFRMTSSAVTTDHHQLFIYGGFDEDDNLDSTVYILDLKSGFWKSVESPITRESHSINYTGDNKVFIYGGVPEDVDDTNDRASDLQKSQILTYNIKTNKWSIPKQSNLENAPSPRSRHATCLSSDGTKLFISGGLESSHERLLDDLYCYDLSTGSWDGPRKFVKRFNHHLSFYNNKLWCFGGLDKNMNYIHSSEIYHYDLDTNVMGKMELFNLPKLIGSHVYFPVTSLSDSFMARSPMIMDVIVPLWNSSNQTANPGYEISTPCITLLDLNDLKWKKLLYGNFQPLNKFIWRHTFIDDNHLYMLGYPSDKPFDYKLNSFIKIKLDELGLKDLGETKYLEKLTNLLRADKCKDHVKHGSEMLIRDINSSNSLDLAEFYAKQEFCDFQIVAVEDSRRPPVSNNTVYYEQSQKQDFEMVREVNKYAYLKSQPINCHLSILLSRWPYLRKSIKSGMLESSEKSIFIPEPVSWIRSLVHYLYTGSFLSGGNSELFGLLVLANYHELDSLYDTLLSVLHVNLSLDIPTAFKIFVLSTELEKGMFALKKKALEYLFNCWGKAVRSKYFQRLSKRQMIQICQEIEEESMIVNCDFHDKLVINKDLNITNVVENGTQIDYANVYTRSMTKHIKDYALQLGTSFEIMDLGSESGAEESASRRSVRRTRSQTRAIANNQFNSDFSDLEGFEEESLKEDSLVERVNVDMDDYYLYQQQMSVLGRSVEEELEGNEEEEEEEMDIDADVGMGD